MIYQKKPDFLKEARLLPEDDPLAPHRTAEPVAVVESAAPMNLGAKGETPFGSRLAPVVKEVFHDPRSILDRAKSCQFCKHHDLRAGQAMLAEREGDLNARIVKEQGFVIDVPEDDGKEAMLDAARRPWYDPKELGLCRFYGDTLTPTRYRGCPQWSPSKGAFAVFVGRKAAEVIDRVLPNREKSDGR